MPYTGAHLCKRAAAYQSQFAVPSGDKAPSAMGSIRPRTPTKAALTARAQASKRTLGSSHLQNPGGRAESPLAEPAADKTVMVTIAQVWHGHLQFCHPSAPAQRQLMLHVVLTTVVKPCALYAVMLSYLSSFAAFALFSQMCCTCVCCM